MKKRKQTLDEVLHIRVTTEMRQQIEYRAQREQRTDVDMIRVLLNYALSMMPRQTVPVPKEIRDEYEEVNA